MYASAIPPAIHAPATETVRLATRGHPTADNAPDVTRTTTPIIAQAVTPTPIRTLTLLPATITVASAEETLAALAAVEVTVEVVAAEAVAAVINHNQETPKYIPLEE